MEKTFAHPPRKSPTRKDKLPTSLEALKAEAEFRPVSKPPRIESFLERAFCFHGDSAYRIFFFRAVLVLDVAHGGSFFLSYRRFALGLVSDVMFGGGFVLLDRWLALGVGFGCYVWHRFRPIKSSVRV